MDLSMVARDNRQISIRLELWVNRELSREGLTGGQAQILMYILEHSERGTSLTALHREFGCSMAAISGLVKRLRKKGYVRVGHCQGDDRCKLLFGTEKGKEIQAFLDDSLQKTQAWIYRGLTGEELATLDRLQKKILRNLSALHTNSHEEASHP